MTDETKEPTRFTEEEWLSKCAYCIMADSDKEPKVHSKGGLIPLPTMIALIYMELAQLEAALNAATVLSGIEQARRDAAIANQLRVGKDKK